MILLGENVSSILITCRNKQLAMRNYVPAIHVAGWHKPIHLVAPKDPMPSLEGVAGLLLSGGGDVNPKHWGEEVHPKALEHLDDERDELELALIKAAWEKGIPILGICRGEQILNVALGGSMVQDIPDHFGCEPSLHQHGTSEIPEVRHNVSVTHNSRLFQLLGAASVPVNSRHHQAVKIWRRICGPWPFILKPSGAASLWWKASKPRTWIAGRWACNGTPKTWWNWATPRDLLHGASSTAL